MGDEAEEGVGAAPFCIVFETDGAEDGKTFDDGPEAAGEDESLQVGHDGLPLVVVGIREAGEGEGVWEEAVVRGDAVVGETGDRRQHDDGCGGRDRSSKT